MGQDESVEPAALDYATNRRVRQPRRRETLLLMLGVSILCAFPAMLVIPGLLTPSDRNYSVDLTKANMGGLTSPLELFRQAMGRYPRNLKELYETPANTVEARKWTGPYIEGPDRLKDAWGYTFCYVAPGVRNFQAYDLWSIGRDGLSGTSDDICNWR